MQLLCARSANLIVSKVCKNNLFNFLSKLQTRNHWVADPVYNETPKDTCVTQTDKEHHPIPQKGLLRRRKDEKGAMISVNIQNSS